MLFFYKPELIELSDLEKIKEEAKSNGIIILIVPCEVLKNAYELVDMYKTDSLGKAETTVCPDCKHIHQYKDHCGADIIVWTKWDGQGSFTADWHAEEGICGCGSKIVYA